MGAFLISLRGSATNSDNALYKFVVDAGSTLDFSVLSRENGLFDFVGKNSETKDALANWGLAAIVWLVIGRIADRSSAPDPPPRPSGRCDAPDCEGAHPGCRLRITHHTS